MDRVQDELSRTDEMILNGEKDLKALYEIENMKSEQVFFIIDYNDRSQKLIF